MDERLPTQDPFLRAIILETSLTKAFLLSQKGTQSSYTNCQVSQYWQE
jgi:hypothetical protein